MSNVTTHRTTVSGVPERSLASRRLQPRPDGPSEELAPRLRRLPSLLVSWIVANVGAFVLGGVMILLGLFVTKVVLASGAIAGADERFPEWLAAHRTAFWSHWSYVGSMIGDAPVLIPLVGLVAIGLVASRRWRTASFVVQAGLVEALAYLVTVSVVSRDRPAVVQIDKYSPTHSFPSGHVAASVAIYGSLALLLTAHFTKLPARVAIWTVAAALPVIVGFARMYRGEHHPIDVAAGALMGVGALLVALFAVRTARAVAEAREGVRIRTFS